MSLVPPHVVDDKLVLKEKPSELKHVVTITEILLEKTDTSPFKVYDLQGQRLFTIVESELIGSMLVSKMKYVAYLLATVRGDLFKFAFDIPLITLLDQKSLVEKNITEKDYQAAFDKQLTEVITGSITVAVQSFENYLFKPQNEIKSNVTKVKHGL